MKSLKMGHVGSKTRPLSQILEKPRLEKPRLCSGDQIFGLILMELSQSVCLDKIVYMFENGSCRVKKYVTRSNHRRSCVCNQGVVI